MAVKTIKYQRTSSGGGHVCMWGSTSAYAIQCRGQRSTSGAFLYCTPPYAPPYIVNRDSLNLDSLLPFQHASSKGACLLSTSSPHPRCCGYRSMQTLNPAFRNSGSHACIASTLSRATSPAHGIVLLKNTLVTKLEHFLKNVLEA